MRTFSLTLLAALALPALASAAPPTKFFEAHCVSCHDADAKKGGLDLTSLKFEPSNIENVALWVKIHDRVAAGEMPPKNKPRPTATDIATALKAVPVVSSWSFYE